jgi:hypothetical protein
LEFLPAISLVTAHKGYLGDCKRQCMQRPIARHQVEKQNMSANDICNINPNEY